MSTEKSAFWRGIMVGGVLMLLTSVVVGQLFGTRVANVVPIIPQDIINAYNKGRTDALRTNPVSADLEMTCLAIWDGKQ